MANPRNISIDDAVKVLNSLATADPVAMKTLVKARVKRDKGIDVAERNFYMIDFLGVLETLFNTGRSTVRIVAKYSDKAGSKLVGFRKVKV